MLRRLLMTNAPRSVLLIRLMVGFVFLSEGIQKFLFPDSVGPGRFAKIGFASPEFVAYFVAVFEIVCGTFIVAGLLTRLAVLPTITIMIVAITTTKIPILRADGFWKMAHEARTDYSMLLGSLFLLVVGAGSWSLDFVVARRMQARELRTTLPCCGSKPMPITHAATRSTRFGPDRPQPQAAQHQIQAVYSQIPGGVVTGWRVSDSSSSVGEDRSFHRPRSLRAFSISITRSNARIFRKV